MRIQQREHVFTSSKVNSIYADYDQRIKDFIKYIMRDLEQTYGDIPDSFRSQFELLSNLLVFYYAIVDVLKETKEPKEILKLKNDMVKLTTQISALCSKLGADPLAKKKLNGSEAPVSNDYVTLDELTA